MFALNIFNLGLKERERKVRYVRKHQISLVIFESIVSSPILNLSENGSDGKIAIVGYCEFVAQHFQKVLEKLKYYSCALYFVHSIV